MNVHSRCPQCNAELAANALRGLCPACLLKGGLGSRTGETGGYTAAHGDDFTPPTPAELASHFPDLEILELIGRGGMGIVYKSRQKSLGRLVALKILSPKIGQNPAFADRFAREARAMAMLSHPHVVAVYDFGPSAGVPPAAEKAGETPALRSDDGLYYFLMEFVDGLNLRQLLDAGKLAPEEALAIVPQICDALQYAHNHGVVHRDIKPENILLDKEGRVKIADFGLAKLMGAESSRHTPCADENGTRSVPPTNLTAVGQVMGTPQYMAPEQIEHPKDVDHRADIYSLGVVFYQMLTGELPTGRFAPPSKRVQIDVRLDEVVLRALEKEPDRRYQNVSEVKTQVEAITSTPSQVSGLSSTDPNMPLRSTRGHYATPEYLLTPRGGLWQWQGSGELALYRDRLLFTSDWQRTEIPLASLQELGLARVPRWMSPPGHKYLSIIYDNKGQRKTLLFIPGSLWMCSPGDTKRRAEECIIAIREAVVAATGKDVPRVTSKPVVMPVSLSGAVIIGLPLLFTLVVNLWLVFGGMHWIADAMRPTRPPLPEYLAHPPMIEPPQPAPVPIVQPPNAGSAAEATGKDVEAVAKRFLTALRQKDIETMKGLSVGAVEGWSDNAASRRAGGTVGLSVMALQTMTKEIRDGVFARAPHLLSEVQETAVLGNFAAVRVPGPDGRDVQHYLMPIFKRTSQGWRFLSIDDARRPLNEELAQYVQTMTTNVERGLPPIATPSPIKRPARASDHGR